MNLNKFLNGFSRLVMAPEGDGGGASGGGSSASAGAPTTATTDTNSNASASATTGTTAGQAAQASGDQTSATASVPAGVGAQTGDPNANTGDFKTRLGDLAKDPTIANFANEADMAKALIETKKLVGQKLGIPGPDATPEAKAAFYEAMGVPKDGAGYDFKKPEGLPDKLAELYSPENSKEWADFFREHGIPKEAANAIRNKYFQEVQKDIEGMLQEADKSDEAFGKVAAEIYGDNAKANAALQSVRTMVEKHVPAQLKAGMEQLSNTALLIMAATIRGETMALTGEDKTISRDNGTSSDGKTVSQLRDEARALQALPEYNSPFTPKGKSAHEKVVADVKAIYDRIGKMG